MNAFLARILSVTLLLSAVAAVAPTPSPAEGAARSPRFVVNLLNYIAADYGGAVVDGKVASPSEYAEQIEFVGEAEKAARALDLPTALAEIDRLKKLVLAKVPSDQVSAQAQKAKRLVITLTGLAVAPIQWPDVRNGAGLFAKNCVTCHGPSGGGDGPAGAALDPKPANFLDARMGESSPLKEFNVIREGVPGTGMVAWTALSDREAWDLAFFVSTLRFTSNVAHAGKPQAPATSIDESRLAEVAGKSDDELLVTFDGTADDKRKALVDYRLHAVKEDNGGSLAFARASLQDADRDYRGGKKESARGHALGAYLEGVEPVEPKLRANDPAFTVALEERMAAVRSAIEGGLPEGEVGARIAAADETLAQAQKLLDEHSTSPWLSFLIAASILLREGFEAVLVLIALLAVIRAAGLKADPAMRAITARAAAWVHAGWIGALAAGFAAWFASGWLMGLSGAGREMLEGVISAFAVVVLLYMGFWLHSRTEMHRWKQFIDGQVRAALEGGNVIALASISFLAVFREAFETVLFLRAVWLDGGADSRLAMAAGVFSSLAVLILASWALIRYSARIPIRKVFTFSSAMMIALAIILAGKAVHALQETGMFSITASAFTWRWDVLGVYPTRETLVAQLVVAVVAGGLWLLGTRPPGRKKAVAGGGELGA